MFLEREGPVEFIDPADIKPWPTDTPLVDAVHVRMVLDGEYNLRWAMRELALALEGDRTTGTQEVCPVGGKPCPEDCRSITVWDLSRMVTKEELLALCDKFGAVANVDFVNREGDEDQSCACESFKEHSAAQLAQASLHRTLLHGKVRLE